MRQITATTVATLLSVFAATMPTVTAEEPAFQIDGGSGWDHCTVCADEFECLWCREQATGDWCGVRQAIADRGVTFKVRPSCATVNRSSPLQCSILKNVRPRDWRTCMHAVRFWFRISC